LPLHDPLTLEGRNSFGQLVLRGLQCRWVFLAGLASLRGHTHVLSMCCDMDMAAWLHSSHAWAHDTSCCVCMHEYAQKARGKRHRARSLTQTTPAHLLQLPDDILECIVRHIAPQSLGRIRCTCHAAALIPCVVPQQPACVKMEWDACELELTLMPHASSADQPAQVVGAVEQYLATVQSPVLRLKLQVRAPNHVPSQLTQRHHSLQSPTHCLACRACRV
jgi:hypothetical protein